MQRICRITLLLASSALSLAFAETPGSRTSARPTVEECLKRLSDGDPAVRAEAAREISNLGVEALPRLREGRSSQDPETRRRLDELIPLLERKFLLSPKTVSLHMTNRSMRDVLNEISKQTGYKIAPWEAGFVPGPMGGQAANGPVYTFQFDKLPFWQALDRVCESSGMVLQQNYWGDDYLRLAAADSYVPFSSYSGPFKVMAVGFSYNRNNNFAEMPRDPHHRGGQMSENLAVNLSIAVEPRLPIIRLGMPKIAEALDGENHSLLPTAQDSSPGAASQRYYSGGSYRTYVQQVQANLAWPSKTARTVKIIRGMIPVSILADQTPSVITEKVLSAKGKKFKLTGASFHIEDVQDLGGKQYQIRVGITEEGKENPNDWTRINTLQQRLELLDAKGNKYHFYFSSMSNNGSSVQATLMVQPPAPNVGPPARLVFHAWHLLDTEVAFEFQGLPLPGTLAEAQDKGPAENARLP
jgi:hypothetical protein